MLSDKWTEQQEEYDWLPSGKLTWQMENEPFGDVWPIENGHVPLAMVILPESICLLFAQICWTWKVVYLALQQNHPFYLPEGEDKISWQLVVEPPIWKVVAKLDNSCKLGVLLAPFGISIMHSTNLRNEVTRHRCPTSVCHHAIQRNGPKEREIDLW